MVFCWSSSVQGWELDFGDQTCESFPTHGSVCGILLGLQNYLNILAKALTESSKDQEVYFLPYCGLDKLEKS